MTKCKNVNFGEWPGREHLRLSPDIRYCRYVFIFYISLDSLGCSTVQHGFGTLAGNLGWHLSNAAGKHCSHGCSLSTQADSLLSRPVSWPATHSSWVGGGVGTGPIRHWRLYVGQCCDTPGNGTKHLTFTSRVFAYIFIWFPLVVEDGCGHVLFADTPIAYNCCVTAQRCSRIPRGHWVLVTCRKSGLAHMQISCLPASTNQRDLACICSHIS